jgi:hypothetical protein
MRNRQPLLGEKLPASQPRARDRPCGGALRLRSNLHTPLVAAVGPPRKRKRRASSLTTCALMRMLATSGRSRPPPGPQPHRAQAESARPASPGCAWQQTRSCRSRPSTGAAPDGARRRRGPLRAASAQLPRSVLRVQRPQSPRSAAEAACEPTPDGLPRRSHAPAKVRARAMRCAHNGPDPDGEKARSCGPSRAKSERVAAVQRTPAAATR